MPTDAPVEEATEVRITTVITTPKGGGELKKYKCGNCSKTAFEYFGELWSEQPGRPDYPSNYKVYECRGKMRVGHSAKSAVCHWRYYVK